MAEEKYYNIGTRTEDEFDKLHKYMTTPGAAIDGVPEREVICVNYTIHSPTRGTYLLTEEEAAELSTRPEIEYINLDSSRYPNMRINPDDLKYIYTPSKKNRYNPADLSNNVIRNYMDYTGLTPTTPTVTENARATSQLWRMNQQITPWSGQNVNTVITANPQQRGTGVDVDLVVGDNGTWIGHPEFMMGVTNGVYPQDFIAGNALSRRDGSTSSTTCNVLDMVFDGPYYLDPDWFNADAPNRLTTRWDGTVVPTETAAKAWWASAAGRSATFPDFGGITIYSLYTRNNAHGSNTVAPYDGTHGTQCASLAFGRTHGWAYNANKWIIDVYSDIGIWFEEYFDVMKIFHLYKPINSKYGTQDPTVSSNSWGFRVTPRTSGFYNHRGTDIAYTNSVVDAPAIMRVVTTTGDGRMKHYPKPNSYLTAGNEMVDAGVIFVAAAGNDSQQQTLPGHPNYNNFHNNVSGATWDQTNYAELGGLFQAYATTNRPGFPQCLGPTEDDRFKVINIGALDHDWGEGTAIGSQENKAFYSDCGPAVDCYAPAEGTLAAASPNDGTSIVNRYDNTYPGMTIDGGTAEDTYFNGTSAACPVAAGLLSTVIQHNRSWTWNEVKNYIKNTIEPQTSATMTIGAEPSTATDANWLDTRFIQGSDPIILYEGVYTNTNSSSLTIKNLRMSGNITLKFD